MKSDELVRMQRQYAGIVAGSPANELNVAFDLPLSLDEIWELIALEFWLMHACTGATTTGGGALFFSLDPDDLADTQARVSDDCVLYVYPESNRYAAAGVNHFEHGLYVYPRGIISAVNPTMGISVVDRAVQEIDASINLMYRVFKPAANELAMALARRR